MGTPAIPDTEIKPSIVPRPMKVFQPKESYDAPPSYALVKEILKRQSEQQIDAPSSIVVVNGEKSKNGKCDSKIAMSSLSIN